MASRKLGDDRYAGLSNINTATSPLLPADGWKFSKSGSRVDDTKLKLEYVHDIGRVQCKQITISGDDLPSHVSQYLGLFTPTRQYSHGRQIFSNKHNKYLQVDKYGDIWFVSDNINDWYSATIRSGCSPSMCPAYPRSGYSRPWNITSWRYKHSDGKWRNGIITIHCTEHQH